MIEMFLSSAWKEGILFLCDLEPLSIFSSVWDMPKSFLLTPSGSANQFNSLDQSVILHEFYTNSIFSSMIN